MTIDHAQADENTPPVREFASHQRQYDRFLHLAKWFVVHLGLLLFALYLLIIAGQAVAGSVLLALAIGALGYGIFSTPQVAHDVEAAIAHDTDRS